MSFQEELKSTLNKLLTEQKEILNDQKDEIVKVEKIIQKSKFSDGLFLMDESENGFDVIDQSGEKFIKNKKKKKRFHPETGHNDIPYPDLIPKRNILF